MRVQFLRLDILERVCNATDPPFRPDISGYDCPPDLAELMNRCWDSNPDERPTFESIRIIIRRTMK